MTQLGLIGCGKWGINHLRNLVYLDSAKLKWVCDADPMKLADIKRRFPHLRCTPVFTEILKDREVDGVLIATPPISHASLAQDALRHGKHVFVEKPFALNREEASRLVRLSERKKKVLMVGHLLRYHPAIIKLKMLIDKGELGEIFYVYSQRLNLGVIRRYENALWNLGCHDISVMLYLLGGHPEAVSAMGRSYTQEDVEDTVFVSLYFPNKRMAHIHASWLDPHKVRKITVVGSRKMAVFDDMEPEKKVIIYNKGFVLPEEASVDAPIEIREGKTVRPNIRMKEPLHLEIQHFVKCIVKGKQPRTDAYEGLQVVDILVAAQKSLASDGNPVPLKLPRFVAAREKQEMPTAGKPAESERDRERGTSKPR